MSSYRNKNVHEITVYWSDDLNRYMPGINVKCYHFPRLWEMNLDIDDDSAERIGNLAYDFIQAEFWTKAQKICRKYFGRDREVQRCGSSGGWLCVDGLPEPVEEWKRPTRTNWYDFEAEIKNMFREVTSEAYVKAYALKLMEKAHDHQ